MAPSPARFLEGYDRSSFQSSNVYYWHNAHSLEGSQSNAGYSATAEAHPMVTSLYSHPTDLS